MGLDVGGQERLLVEFARHADRARFNLVFISLTGRGKLARTIEDLGWPVFALEAGPGLRPRMVCRLVHLLRRQSCDVVHTHDDKPLLYGSLAARLAGVRRHIHTQHHGLLPQMTPRQRKLTAWAGRLADSFVCVSQDGARHMEETGLPAGRITTLWNGIDLERYPQRGPRLGGVAVAVARLSPEKDIANLLRAVALVVPSAPDFRLEIAGDGPLRAELRQLRTDLHLQEQVCFLGEVDNVPDLLERALLFALPSRTEGISLTILEAMACGLPVVATAVGGNPEVVLPGVTGLLAPAGDPLAIAKCLLQFWKNPEEGRLMGNAGRRRVETHFDIRVMVARYERLYRQSAASSLLQKKAIVWQRSPRPCAD
jgi:glycosyltransferase involved in cell wall biosynthesis